MDQLSLVVHESGRRWVEQVRAHMRGLPLRVRHSTLAKDCLDLIRAARQTTLVLELGPRPLAALELLEQAYELDRTAKVVVMANRNQASLELAARELGALEFFCEPIVRNRVTSLLDRVVRAQLADQAHISSYTDGNRFAASSGE